MSTAVTTGAVDRTYASRPQPEGPMTPALKLIFVLAAFLCGPVLVIVLLGWGAWLLIVPAGAVSATIVVLLGVLLRRSGATKQGEDQGE